MPETKSLITPRSGRVVKAYIEKIMKLKPQVRKTFGFYAAMMAEFGFPTSSRYNALHGPLALAGLVASMSYNRSCGNKAAKLLALSAVEAAGDDDACIRSAHLPTSQWALGLIASLDHDRIEGACNAAFHACTDASRRRGMIPERPVGMMDGHSTAYYGKKGDKSFIIKSKKKDGTTKFNVFLSSAIRAGPYLLHTAMHRMRRGEQLAGYVKGILGQNRGSGVYCDHWLVDRMFFSVAAMSEFGRADEYFLMYAKMTPGIKKALAEYEDGKRNAVSEYVVKSGRAKFTGVLAFVKKTKTKEDGTREEVVLPFFSNMPRRRLEAALCALPPEMKKRWIHESGFRVAKMSRPMTASNNPSIRTFMFWASLAAANMWAMTDHGADIERRAREGMPPLPLPPPNEGLGGPSRPSVLKKYNLTSKEFLRMFVTEVARLLVQDKRAQDDYVERAVGENARLVLPMIMQRRMTTGVDASGLPRWA